MIGWLEGLAAYVLDSTRPEDCTRDPNRTSAAAANGGGGGGGGGRKGHNKKKETEEELFKRMREAIQSNKDLYEKLLVGEVVELTDIHNFLTQECGVKVDLLKVRKFLDGEGAMVAQKWSQRDDGHGHRRQWWG